MEKKPNKTLTGLMLVIFTLLAIGLILLGQKDPENNGKKPGKTLEVTPTITPSSTPTPNIVAPIPKRDIITPQQSPAGQSAQPNNTTIINNNQQPQQPTLAPQPTPIPQPTQQLEPTRPPLICALGICL